MMVTRILCLVSKVPIYCCRKVMSKVMSKVMRVVIVMMPSSQGIWHLACDELMTRATVNLNLPKPPFQTPPF